MTDNVRKASSTDIDSVVNVHLHSFQDFFLTHLGKSFLTKYYQMALRDPSSIFLVYIDTNKNVTGFAVGFNDPSKFYGKMKSVHGLVFFIPLFKALLKRPSLILNMGRSLFHLVFKRSTSMTSKFTELASIGVLNPGGGVGSTLLKAFLNFAKVHGAFEVRLTTDRDNNDSANYFYTRHGFEVIGSEQKGDRHLNIYSYSIG